MAITIWTIANEQPTAQGYQSHPIKPVAILSTYFGRVVNKSGVTLPIGGSGTRPANGQMFPRGQG